MRTGRDLIIPKYHPKSPILDKTEDFVETDEIYKYGGAGISNSLPDFLKYLENLEQYLTLYCC